MSRFFGKSLLWFSRFLILLIAGIATVSLGAYLAFLAYQTIFYVPNVTVPSVLNMDLDNAQQTFYQSGLKMKIMDEDLFREGNLFFVKSQNPPAGSVIKKNRMVEVEIKQTQGSELIPDLIGKTVEEATILLSGFGCQIEEIAYSIHSRLEKGRIIAQSPNPGETIPSDAGVNILVSKGVY